MTFTAETSSAAKMTAAGLEIAAAFGFRDRILGIDSGERAFTLSRFDGVAFLERAYCGSSWNLPERAR